ncbi:MAG: thermonuclease family protein [Desulfobacteraceae bacterium]|jgi:endonuclease YncB( thermonuclease family)
MKRHFILISLLIALLCPGICTGEVRVRFVVDGDTVYLEDGERVRYAGVDAPEMAHEGCSEPEFLAEAARRFNERAVQGKRIRLEMDRERRGRHGRLLAYVYLEDGSMINRILLQEGLAHVMTTPPNVRHRQELLSAQREAMASGRGIWGVSSYSTGSSYVGSRKSYRFHRMSCRYARRIAPSNRVLFETLRQAFWRGYSPCTQCLP